MKYDEASPETADSYRETEQRLECLRILVCELLKTNEELRQALSDSQKAANDRLLHFLGE